MNESNLTIDFCTSSNTNMIELKSNCTPTLCIDNVNQNRDKLIQSPNTVSNDFIQLDPNSSQLQLTEQNNSSNIDTISFNTVISFNKKEKLISSSKNNEENILKHKNMVDSVKCKDSSYFCCKCHCLIYEQRMIIDHIKKCKQNLHFKYIRKFYCFICEKTMKSLLDWKSHAISTNHLNKCLIKNDFNSYDCGGCKSLFFGNKDQILNHCKDVHNDSSGLPCIYKCMKDVFNKFIFKSSDNWMKQWTYCGICKKYSQDVINCIHSNHNIKHKRKRFKCDSCLIYFICSQDVYNKHLISCEHIMFEHLNTHEKSEYRSISNLKLPPVILNRFILENKNAICNDCQFQLELKEKDITVHLSECILKSDIDGINTININSYFCEVCNEILTDFNQWKFHLILSSHLIKCHDAKNLVSYTCEICLLHCYGNVNHVTEHQKIHPNNSEKNLSMYLAFNFQRINKDFNSKEFYYCEDCETYAEINNHWNRSHKTKLKRTFCQPCRTEFLCSEENNLFDKHILTSEHIILKYATTKKSPLEFKTSLTKSRNSSVLNDEYKKSDTKKILDTNKSYLNWFKTVDDERKVACISCANVIHINENNLLTHLLVCNKNSTKVVSKMGINNFKCMKCVFEVNDFCIWEKHIILHAKSDTCMYSYVCKICNSLLFGKINNIECHLNYMHKVVNSDMPIEITLITKQLTWKNNNACKSSEIKCICEPCKKIFDVNENYNHFNTNSHISMASDLVELFYCKYCQLEFYSSIIVYECHKLSTEHIKLSSGYSNIDDETIPKPLQLDAHLHKFVSNQNLYNKTQNIGFFCFVCDYLCLSLDVWKNHINEKKHINLSKGLCMDHRCKICKTLLFGQRQFIIKHYSNPFHSMLREFKLMTATDDVLPNNFETNYIQNINYISKYNHTIQANILEDSSCTTINSLTKMMDKISHESSIQNYSNFFRLKINMLNDLLNQNKEIKKQLIYYCAPCDYITTLESNLDDHNLSNHSNEIEVRNQIYCDTCNLYQIGPLDNLNEHINTIEHKNMVDFQKICNSDDKSNSILKTKEIVDTKSNNCISDKSSNITKTLITDKQDNKNSKKIDKEFANRKIMIEIKDAKPLYKKNYWVELKKIFSTYGYFTIYPKQNSVIIIFRKFSCMEKMLKEKEKLEKQHDFTICVVVEDDHLPELHKTTEYEFGNKNLLLKTINTQLMVIKQEITNPDIHNRLFLLINSIHRCASQYFLFSKTYAFGSRMSGLALKESDVDLYFDIGNTFNGSLSNDIYAQEDLVRYFGKVFRSQNNEFKHVQQITGARVPIVKFLHGPSGLNCDLSFKSGLSTHNTKLVRLYLTLDERIHWIVCAVVKRWALQNDLKHQSMFTSYALAWLVLFYLMTIKVVPPLKILRDNASPNSDIMFIEDWDCTFCSIETAKQIWRVPEISCWDLLYGFFKFYSDPNRLKQFVLCPAIGEAIPKEKFFDIPLNSRDILGFYKRRNGSATQRCMKLRDNFYGEGLALQDPFDLFHNITKTIVPRKLQSFSHLCNKTLEVMNKGTQPYYA